MHQRVCAGKASSVLVLIMSMLLSLPLLAQADGEGYTVIHTEKLASLVAADVWDFYLIDARTPVEFEEVHIKGAMNVPQPQFDEYAKLLPKDKDVKLVFYCNGVKCGKSKKAAKQAVASGYTNVFVYAEGMPVWEEQGLPIFKGPAYEAKIQTTVMTPAELKKLVDSDADGFTVVDVRDNAEFAEGHIPSSINIPVGEFASESGVLDKHKKIIVYCNSGGRSYRAYRKLMKLGYKNIYQAVFADWKEAGYPVAN
jgi:rhodanese-related sulfurtransferase